jgi:hypothetical protein
MPSRESPAAEVPEHGLDAQHVHVGLALLEAARRHEHQLAHARGVVERQPHAHRATHGVAHQVHLLGDAEAVQHAHELRGEVAHEELPLGGLAAVAVAEHVGHQRAVAGRVERRVVALEVAPAAGPGARAVDEEHGAAVGHALGRGDIVEVQRDSATDVDVLTFGHCRYNHDL